MIRAALLHIEKFPYLIQQYPQIGNVNRNAVYKYSIDNDISLYPFYSIIENPKQRVHKSYILFFEYPLRNRDATCNRIPIPIRRLYKNK